MSVPAMSCALAQKAEAQPMCVYAMSHGHMMEQLHEVSSPAPCRSSQHGRGQMVCGWMFPSPTHHFNLSDLGFDSHFRPADKHPYLEIGAFLKYL